MIILTLDPFHLPSLLFIYFFSNHRFLIHNENHTFEIITADYTKLLALLFAVLALQYEDTGMCISLIGFDWYIRGKFSKNKFGHSEKIQVENKQREINIEERRARRLGMTGRQTHVGQVQVLAR